MGVLNWSLSAARNALVDPLIRALDGASARDYPGMVRGVMSGVRALSDDRGGALVSEGTGNSYTIRTLSGVSELRPGVTVSFWADRDNTDAPSLNVDGTGPNPLRAADGTTLPPGAIQRGRLYTAAWSAILDTPVGWVLVGSGDVGGGGGTILKPDASGSLVGRSAYNLRDPGFVYLAVSTVANVPTWTMYIKQGVSGTDADWSVGLPIKASPAQSTADAQVAATAATGASATAVDRAAVATAQAAVAIDRATVATTQAGTASAQAAIAVDRAGVAVAQATLATQGAQTASDAAISAAASRDAATGAAASATAAATTTTADRTQTQIDRAAMSNAVTLAQSASAGAQAAVADARAIVNMVGAPIYDFSYDSAADPSNDWSAA